MDRKKPSFTPEQDDSPFVLVKNINFKVRSNDVYNKFLKFGGIEKVSMFGDECVIYFWDYRDASRAITEYNGKDIFGLGKNIKLSKD